MVKIATTCYDKSGQRFDQMPTRMFSLLSPFRSEVNPPLIIIAVLLPPIACRRTLIFLFVTSPALLDPLKDFRECPCRQCHNEVERVISKSVGRLTLTEPVMERFSISSSQSLTLAQPTAVQWDQSQQAVCLGPSIRTEPVPGIDMSAGITT
jgi:hypothetical protein